MPPKLPPDLRFAVRERANYLCEYCHTNERWQLVQFTIDHIVPLNDGGSDDLENLALACFHCNRRKSDKQTVVDPDAGQSIPIYNPRTMIWSEHFVWSEDGLTIVPLSNVGKVTVELLKLNRDHILQIRQDDKLVNRHPPMGDRINK